MEIAATLVSSSLRAVLLGVARSPIQGARVDCAELARTRSASGASWRPELVWAASKQKTKKRKERRKDGGGRGRSTHGWSFDALMLVWDEAFDRCCADAGRAAAVRALGKQGLQR